MKRYRVNENVLNQLSKNGFCIEKDGSIYPTVISESYPCELLDHSKLDNASRIDHLLVPVECGYYDMNGKTLMLVNEKYPEIKKKHHEIDALFITMRLFSDLNKKEGTHFNVLNLVIDYDDGNYLTSLPVPGAGKPLTNPRRKRPPRKLLPGPPSE